ncbi:MAG: SMI1/KNR4 family protein [Winogradskyella sp.]|uniref:SMI1/KNR4 family protein n=1 Tax=Winogradskyella sp. TaxID=1883156 RepID=UPI00385DADB4
MSIWSFFKGNSQHNHKSNYDELTPELKIEIKNLLQSDKAKDFNTEYIRTTNLEKKIITQYGFEAIKLIYERSNSSNYFQLGEFPKESPWFYLNNHNVEGFIKTNFKSILKNIPDLIDAMITRCQFIYAEKKEDCWQLHYLLDMKLYDNREYFKIYTGRAPILNPSPNTNLANFKWNIPEDLKTFYTIHDGFGDIYGANYIMSNAEIKIMAELMNPISKENNTNPEGYEFSDLLEFFPDGSGNAQCFYKNNSNATVDWDHETWEISGETKFFHFINERMGEIDEE